MKDENKGSESIDTQENALHNGEYGSENLNDSVDEVIHNITLQVERLEAIREVQEERARSFRLQIANITDKMKAALFEKARAIRISKKMRRLIS